MTAYPLPPVDLANRVGRLVGPDGSFAAYEAVGKSTRNAVVDALPADWTWRDKRVLDFGCGAGRTLRQFVAEAAMAEFWGCDIDSASVEWVNANLDPPFRAFVNDELPPLPQPHSSFDLIYALSVFTHITAAWSVWLLELHRLLRPGGLLIASYLGEGMSEAVADEQWEESRVGMNVLRAHQGWELGGPVVMMSPWWIREHWGRLFEIVALHDTAASGSQGLIVARRRPNPLTRAELERVDIPEPREIIALRHNIAQLQRESAAATAELRGAIARIEDSLSWRLTRPLRALRKRISR